MEEKHTHNSPVLSICIPAYGRLEYVRNTLRSIYDNSNLSVIDLDDFEVILSDNDPECGLKSLRDEFQFDNFFYFNTHCDGFMNSYYVLTYAKGQLLKLHNSQEIWNPGSLSRIIGIVKFYISEKPLFFFSGGLLYKGKTFEVNNFEWNIIGVNECRYAEKITRIKSSDVNVQCKGVLSAEQVIECLVNSDLFVHTSYIDNSPNSICEAQMIGVPVISTNVGGISSLIENNISGILVPPNDPFYLASKMITLFNNKDYSLKLGTKGREIALQRHNQNTIVSGLIEIYESVLKCNL